MVVAESGVFIVFEGTEGSGKSTQAAGLAERLGAAGLPVVLTREPGGTPLGERVRALLLDPEGCVILPEAEALLFSAARAQHVRAVIAPALAAGAVVVCDRFVDSTLAYQGGGHGVSMPALLAAQDLATGGVRPDLRLLLDVAVEDGLRRRFASSEAVNRIDAADVAFHIRVATAYRHLAAADPGGWATIPASGTPAEVATVVTAAIRDRLPALNRRWEAAPGRGSP